MTQCAEAVLLQASGECWQVHHTALHSGLGLGGVFSSSVKAFGHSSVPAEDSPGRRGSCHDHVLIRVAAAALRTSAAHRGLRCLNGTVRLHKYVSSWVKQLQCRSTATGCAAVLGIPRSCSPAPTSLLARSAASLVRNANPFTCARTTSAAPTSSAPPSPLLPRASHTRTSNTAPANEDDSTWILSRWQ